MHLYVFVVFCYPLYAFVTQRGGSAFAPPITTSKILSFIIFWREGGAKKQLSNMSILEMGAVKTPSLLFPFIPFYSLFDLAESRMERKEILKRMDFWVEQSSEYVNHIISKSARPPQSKTNRHIPLHSHLNT